MKIPTYVTIKDILSEEGLHTTGVWQSAGCYKTIEGYSCQNSAGVKMEGGYRHEWPEFYIDGDVIKVNVHAIASQNKWTLIDTLGVHIITAERWDDIDRCLGLADVSTTIFHRSRKTGLALSRWVSSLQENPDGTLTQKITDAIMREARCIPEEYEYEWLTGGDLVDWYSDNDDASHSCMTGCDNCEKTRVWSTNGNQCRLLVLKKDERAFARCLCYRPLPSLDASKEEVPLGPGWAYSRIYPVNGAACRSLDSAASWMHRKGMVEIGHRSVENGMVPLKVTELSPYIDRGNIMVKTTGIGDKALYVVPGYRDYDNLRSEGWRPIENNQYGVGFGRRNSENDCLCACCDEYYDGDDMTHIMSYGDVCSDCFSNGDFVEVCDGDYYHTDDTMRIVSVDFDTNGDRIQSSSEDRYVYLRRTSDNERVRVKLVRAIHPDGEHILCPESETLVGAGDSDRLFINGDPSLFIEVDQSMTFRNGLPVLRPISRGWMDKNDCVSVDGVMVSILDMDHLFKSLVTRLQNPSFTVNYHNAVYIDGVRRVFIQINCDYVVYDNSYTIIHTSNLYDDDGRPKVGQPFRGVPALSMIAHPMRIDDGIDMCNLYAHINTNDFRIYSGDKYGNGVRASIDTQYDCIHKALTSMWLEFNPITDNRWGSTYLRAVDKSDPHTKTTVTGFMTYRGYAIGLNNGAVSCIFAGTSAVVMHNCSLFFSGSAEGRNAIKNAIDAIIERDHPVNKDKALCVALDFAQYNQGATV